MKKTVLTVINRRLTQLKLHYDLGCGIFVAAKAKTDFFIVKTGVLGLWVSLTASEAVSFIDQRIEALKKKIEAAELRTAEIRAHISTVSSRQFVEALRCIELGEQV